MKNVMSPLLCLLLAVLLVNCQKEDFSEEQIIGRTRPGNPVRFDRLAVGQQSQYLLAGGRVDPVSGAADFRYSGDTLLVTVLDSTARGFLVSETLSAGSPFKDNFTGNACDTLLTYYRIRNDTLYVSAGRSYCSYSSLYDLLPVALPLTAAGENPATADRWAIRYPRTESWQVYGYLPELRPLDVTYSQLNYYAADRRFNDLNLVVVAYGAATGVVRSYGYNGLSLFGGVADLITRAE